MSRLAGFFNGRSTSDTPVNTIPRGALVWLIGSFSLLLLPQLNRLPWWLVAACAVLAGWRWLAQSGRVRLPGRWLRTGIMLVLIAVYIGTVQGRFTVDTAASFFVLAVGLKWLETRSARDFYVLFFILVYLSAVNFLFQQGILWAILTFAAIGCLLIGLQVLNAPDLPDSMKSGWKRLGLLLVKTLPVVVLLFVFFPRMAPLWSVPLVSGEARSGISDTMRPGDISNLAQSSERAFRVTFGGAPPAYRDRYWRGLILDYLDGETWRQRDVESYQRPGRVAVDGGVGALASNQYDVLMEPTDQRWAFSLENSMAVSDNVFDAGEDLFRFRRPADSAVRYRLAVEPGQVRSNQELSPAVRQRYLQLPSSANPRARELADQLAAAYAPDQVVNELMTRFREQEYFYTLRPPAMPRDGVDALLFDEKRGFCAHYAGAATFVFRAAGIPSRVVIGYQGGDAGAGDEYLIVRQYDAHAWVEVWLEGRGWVRVDPTAAIAPSRIEFGLREAMAEEGSFLENSFTSPQRYGDLAMLQWASLQLDRINYHWQRWVVGYQGQSQMNLMSRLPGGIGMRELGYITAGLVGFALLVAGLVSALSMRRGARQDGFRRVVSGWHRLCEQAGVPVRSGETPGALADRLAQARPAVSDTARIFARTVNSHYYNAPSVKSEGEDARRLRRLLKTMKRQLRRGDESDPVPRTP
ncbi:MAG: transglutaminase-like protein [Marinobacter excellens HL-55]|uniref:Transglutaminase-like protein n=1 Tax=Marinobacter excellens HL-55 TaxID=1305731 RepID=A0A0P7ZDC1_9GAMM|nr:MAG: transglutaminase-like protein [Marinobacter excellens HL-55]